jgi:chitinase
MRGQGLRVGRVVGVGLMLGMAASWSSADTAGVTPRPWVTGYLPGYRHTDDDVSCLTAADYAMLTHLCHAGAIPRADGSLDTEQNSVTPGRRRRAVTAAHEAGVPILIVIGGGYADFREALRPDVRPAFVRNIVTLMEGDGYDGVDLDMEPVTTADNPGNPDYIAFVKELHAALQGKPTPLCPRPLLTAAIMLRDAALWGRPEVHDRFDQVNLMVYDMAGPYEGWVTWFDSALHNGGYTFPGLGNPISAIDLWVDECLAAGIPAAKLGLGLCFDALCWQGGTGTPTGGVTAPRQSWTTPPGHPHTGGGARLTYAEMLDRYPNPELYHWDEAAEVPYLSIDQPGSDDDVFVSFNDARSCAAKVRYARDRGLGGFIIWELSADYRAAQPEGQRRPLRQAVAEAIHEYFGVASPAPGD